MRSGSTASSPTAAFPRMRTSRSTARRTCPASSRPRSRSRATTASTSTRSTWAWSSCAGGTEAWPASTSWSEAASAAPPTSRRRFRPWLCRWRSSLPSTPSRRPVPDREGSLAGVNLLVGGGLGRTANKPETFATVALPLAFVAPEHAVTAARAVVSVQRDHGDRANRRHARLKYLIHDRGIPWFRDRVQERVDFKLLPARPLSWTPVDDHLGWHRQADGRLYYGLFVENGRIKDEGAFRLRTALRLLVEQYRPALYLTAQQNVIIAGLDASAREPFERLLQEHGVPLSGEISNTVRHSMGWPAYPTCGPAVAESERA